MARLLITNTPPGCTEWVPSVSMDPAAHFGSSWRVAGHGKALTNRRILALQLEGHYGKDAQLRAHKKVVLTRKGEVYKCKCGAAIGVRLLHYSYLPQAGWWCPKCVSLHRDTRDKERETARALREALENGTLYE